jgi:lysophospholipid acyltransferase (LPLAT)-like uncharacterized protein
VPAAGEKGGDGPATGTLWAGTPPASGRKLTRGRRLLYRALAPLLSVAVRLLWATCRVRSLEVHPDARALLASGEPIIPCSWHRDLVLCMRQLLRGDDSGRSFCLLVSPSVDGELVAMTIQRWDVRVVRGSATRTGGKAIRDLYRIVMRERLSLVVLPDGPKGPPGEFKPGAVMLAQLSGAPVLPMACVPRRAFELSSWDRLLVPLPFTRVSVVIGAPEPVDRDLAADAIEPESKRLAGVLDDLTRRAEAAL